MALKDGGTIALKDGSRIGLSAEPLALQAGTVTMTDAGEVKMKVPGQVVMAPGTVSMNEGIVSMHPDDRKLLSKLTLQASPLTIDPNTSIKLDTKQLADSLKEIAGSIKRLEEKIASDKASPIQVQVANIGVLTAEVAKANMKLDTLGHVGMGAATPTASQPASGARR